MAITLQRWIDTAVMLAGVDRPGLVTEAMLLTPRVIYRVTDKFAATEATRHLVTIREALTSTNGVLTPGSLMLKYLRFAQLEDGTTPTPDLTFSKKMRWVEDWREFTRPLDIAHGYFTGLNVSGSPRIVFTAPGTAYTPISGPNMDIALTAVQMPAIPTLPTSNLTTPPEVENEMVLMLAAALKDPTVLLVSPVEVAV